MFQGESTKKAASWTGIVPYTDVSADKKRTGKMTEQGNSWLRRCLGQIANVIRWLKKT
jgi:transposase